ncbi:MAG: DUF4835 family protein [Balneolaceae bacterium]
MGLFAQEFNCDVIVDVKNLEGTSFDYVKASLEADIENYINEYRWTEIEFTEQERITCQISIVLTSGDQDFNFSAETILSARRPIYNTTTETTTLIVGDQAWQFSYPQGRSLIHDDLQFEGLTGFIDYYVYLLLGYDFDSFSPLGGTEYFEKSQNVLDLAQNEQTIGWTRNSNNQRNRFTLITDLLNTNYQPLRNAIYTYHRLGLDTFTQSPESSRQQVLAALKEIQAAKRRSTSNFLYDVFFDTKSREITNIFIDASSQVKVDAYNILRITDQGHLTEYDQLQN